MGALATRWGSAIVSGLIALALSSTASFISKMSSVVSPFPLALHSNTEPGSSFSCPLTSPLQASSEVVAACSPAGSALTPVGRPLS